MPIRSSWRPSEDFASETPLLDAASGSSEGMLALPAPPPYLATASSSNDMFIRQNLDENGHRYVGLVNQAMTCYLNSLIQTLYMTPEFRNALYEWEYTKSGSHDTNIPCQLQKLFLLLQTSDRDSLETKELTTSFGWNSNEAYDQHDVQELCRLMFDALEVRWKNTKHAKLIEDLYRGTMQDFVKCLNCGRESVKEDFFLDLPLAVREFGATEAFKSIEEALRAFVQPELLSGQNQYFCENCQSKQDAHKGLRITQFPYLLTIQLKRFDFDYNTLHRIKLNDRMTFPDLLNLNEFVVKPASTSSEKKSDAGRVPKISTSEPMDQSSPDEGIANMYPEQGNSSDGSETNGNEVKVGRPIEPKEVEALLHQGDAVYELFSVMVHQGNAAGGHYFAYIKNLKLDKWFCFNDTSVERASPEEIARSYGGPTGGWTTSNTNAYMLMYRQRNPKRNLGFCRTSELPAHLVALQERWRLLEEQKEEQRRYTESLVKPLEKQLSAKYASSITSMPELHFILDYKRPRGMFSTAPDMHQIRTLRINTVHIGETAATIEPSFLIGVRYDDSISQLRRVLGSVYNEKSVEYENYRLVVEKGSAREDEGLNIVPGDMPLPQALEGVHSRIPAFYVDGGHQGPHVTADRKRPLEQSLLYKVLDRKKFSLQLIVCFPKDEEIAMARATAAESQCGDTSSLTDPRLARTFEMESVGEEVMDEQMAGSSGRGSSMMSESGLDDLISPQNNTPEMSPNVSESEDNATAPPEVDKNFMRESGWYNVAPGIANSTMGNLDSALLGRQLANLQDEDRSAWQRNPAEFNEESGSAPGKNSPGMDQSAGSSSGTLVPWPGAANDHVEVLESFDQEYRLDVDGRASVGSLKSWIGGRMGLDPTQFVLIKHHKDDDTSGFEAPAQRDDDPIRVVFANLYKVSIKLRPPLRDDEKMIRVMRFELNEYDRDKWTQLFEIPASEETLVSKFLMTCKRLYELSFEPVELNQLRLRDFSSGLAPFKHTDQLKKRGNQWSNNLCLQISEEYTSPEYDVVMVRRFRPSAVEVGPIEEVCLRPDEDPISELIDALAKKLQVPPKRVHIAPPTTSAWDKWPYARARLDLLDTVVFDYTERGDPALISKGRVFYYKDADEEPRKLSDEERKAIRIKDNSSSTSIIRRKERPLRIQMSSISEP